MSALVSPLAAFGRFSIFSAAVLVRVFRGGWSPSAVIKHVYNTSTRCVLPVIAVTFPFGMVLALQGLQIFAIFGAQRMLPSLVAVAMLRELSPVLASVLVAAQGGSSCAAELGSMRLKEELDATAVMAVDPITCHVVPRFVAMVIVCPLLNVVGSISGIAGSFVTAVFFKGEVAGVFLGELWVRVGPVDLWGGTLKTVIFGAIIGMTACYMGHKASGGAAGVGRAVNDTVVYGVIGFVLANYALTSALFGAVGG